MKILVDQLPYYNDFCPFWMMCRDHVDEEKCPIYWGKYKVCSDENPHECMFFRELIQGSAEK